jgi:hypothetical protein
MKKIVKITEKDLNNIVTKVLKEAEDEKPYEKGKFGVRASRSRADYTPTPKESEIIDGLFGKYGDDVPPIVIRYLRKMGKKTLTKRLCDLNMIDPETVMDEFDLGEE